MPRSRLYWIAGVLVLLVIGLVLFQRSESPVSPADEAKNEEVLPTFPSTPSPIRYASLKLIAAAIEEAGLGCSEVQAQDPEAAGHETLKEFGTCFLMTSPSLNVDLWLFEGRGDRDQWLNVMRGETVVVFGPNWIVTPQDEARASAIQGAIGGEIIPADPIEEASPTS